MPTSREELLAEIFTLALERALQGQDEEGHLDADTQHEVDRIAALAEEPALSELLAEIDGQRFATDGQAAGWVRKQGPKGGTYWQRGDDKRYQEEKPGLHEGEEAEFVPDEEPAPSAGKRAGFKALVGAGIALGRAGLGVSRERLGQLAALTPEPVAAPVLNAWHAIHGVLMAGNTAMQGLARQVASDKGLSEGEVTSLARTLGAVDLAFQGSMMAAAIGAAALAPQLALVAKGASYVPIASIGYVTGSAVKNPIGTLSSAWKLLKEKFPGQIRGAATFAWGAVRHPLTSAAPHKEHFATRPDERQDIEQYAEILADHLAAAADPEQWLALFSVAFDETRDVGKAVRMAEEVAPHA